MKNNKNLIKNSINFMRHDIWRMTEHELTKSQSFLFRIIKVIILSTRYFINERLSVKASALTYSILFALVPMVALIMAIGRGLGVEDLIQKSLEQSFEAQSNMIPTVMGFVQRYLETTQGGVFIGIGIIILLASVMNFFIQVELAFNEIWQVKKPRSTVNRFTMYFSSMLIIPIFIVLSAGISIYINTVLEKSILFDIINPIVKFAVKATPYILNGLLFTVMYRAIPNTKVNFKDALIAGIIAGTAFQIFQVLYIKGQVLLSRYDMVYGSFAAIPLLLLWLQISCLIVLFGADIAYASQNIKNYEFEADSKSISSRYKNFLTLFITWLVVKKYQQQLTPLSSNQIADEHKIPIRLVHQITTHLIDSGVFIEVFNETDRNKTFLPAIDINQLTIAVLIEKLENHGSSHFLENKNDILDDFWVKTNSNNYFTNQKLESVLIKDI